jgi:chromosome partitioning protein
MIPSHINLVGAEIEMLESQNRESVLKEKIGQLKDEYDFIVIDCPPALGLITYNAMIAADHLVMVTTADALSYSGLVMVANLFADVKSNERLNKGLKLTGVVVTRYEKNKLSELYLNKIKEELGQAFISPVIRKATKMQQAASIKQSIYDLDPSGKATADYIDVAQNLALRILQ